MKHVDHPVRMYNSFVSKYINENNLTQKQSRRLPMGTNPLAIRAFESARGPFNNKRVDLSWLAEQLPDPNKGDPFEKCVSREKIRKHLLSYERLSKDQQDLCDALSKHGPISSHGLRYIYCLRNDEGKPLYVGQTHHLKGRIQSHKNGQYWFGEVKDVKFELCEDKNSFHLVREKFLIKYLKPIYNGEFREKNTYEMPPMEWTIMKDLALEYSYEEVARLKGENAEDREVSEEEILTSKFLLEQPITQDQYEYLTMQDIPAATSKVMISNKKCANKKWGRIRMPRHRKL